MRLFFYYISHTFVNTIKKLMKTWVAIIIIMMVFGALIGFASSFLGRDSDGDASGNEITVETVDEEEGSLDGEIESTMDEWRFANIMKKYDLTKEQVVDLAISALFLLLLATNIINSQNSSKIFLPADVPMLFASPLKPQSVLMFRLISTLGTSLFISLFMLFQIPNLVHNMEFGMWGAFSLVIVYALILVFSTLVQVVFYTITSKMKTGTGNMKNALAVVYGAIAVGFAAYTFANKMSAVEGMFSFFANPATHWVPFWGWLRGISYYAITGDVMMSLIYLGLFVAACAMLIFFVWKMKADFYEDAMFAAEHKAEQLESAKNASKGAVMTREKERKGKIEREGFHYGSGANVFFYKAVFNRFRFAKLKIFSTTMIVYTVIAGVAAWLARTAPLEEAYVIPAAVLGVMAFYRTLGDPIREDTSRDFFVLVPEKHYTKIMYSLLGCLAVTAIDLALPVIISAIILGANPVSVIVWFLFILSISFFATVAGTLISLSLPKDQMQTISVIAQMMFFYFGLTPSAAAVIIGVVTGHLAIAVLAGAVINFITGFLVSLFLPLALGRK
ncbi:MAG: putative ABC exporter domain-containing protein [Lachnospiraceae bacterium]|nr:putative ABC exporter domain-containing protein [Lachnospiraceae bacterium]